MRQGPWSWALHTESSLDMGWHQAWGLPMGKAAAFAGRQCLPGIPCEPPAATHLTAGESRVHLLKWHPGAPDPLHMWANASSILGIIIHILL